MIQLLATRYNKHAAYFFSFIFYIGIIIPVYGSGGTGTAGKAEYYASIPAHEGKAGGYSPISGYGNRSATRAKQSVMAAPDATQAEIAAHLKKREEVKTEQPDIDGPGQPEMSSFKPAGTNDMVNLFTGDFSYNIPLLDVGGYPVNIYYDGGITMEQEASWVGLGWNINPGNVNRNMRGVPDDFNGEDILVQKQNMKKNITWGVGFGADLELVGIKDAPFIDSLFSLSVGGSIGYSLNNYLGPAIELGLKGTAGIKIGAKALPEKFSFGVSAGMSANLNSRSGMTLTPNISLSAKSILQDMQLSNGIGLSTGYNSRTGIKALQLYNQVSLGYDIVRQKYNIKTRERMRGITIGSSSMSTTLSSSSISFTKPSYVPALRSPVTNKSGAGRFQIGGGMFGIFSSLEVEGYGQVSSIEEADRVQKKPMVGYLYAEKAKNNRDAVMDFSRFNDQEVTPNTTIISVPQYAYDVFSIQGEGTGGTIRAYRNDNGYVRDNFTVSRDKNWSAGIDVGIPGHIGGNFNTVKTPSTIGEWGTGNGLKDVTGFRSAQGLSENVYFRNPGENSVLHPDQYDSIGGLNLVRYKLGGYSMFPRLEPKLQIMSASGAVLEEKAVQKATGITERKKRTQVTSFLTAADASVIGLDKKIKVYSGDPMAFIINSGSGNRVNVSQEIDRVSDYRKPHHISQVNVTETDGKRYVYGIPVYNTVQKDFSFTVEDPCTACETVTYNPATETSLSAGVNPHLDGGVGGKDGYVQITETPPYAHSFLLSGLLSSDYVDVTGNGITEDDLGGAVKFNYTMTGTHKWRTPLDNGNIANSNPGNLSERRDDKAIIAYGERESWYLQSVESKTMIAFFTLDNRNDGKGVSSEFSNVNYGETTLKRLKRIDLYNKADLVKNGLAGAKPVKSVHFEYNYSLCSGTKDNQAGGKLTLEKVWFTYNGQRQNSLKKNQYVFSYSKTNTVVTGENPGYTMNASDRWGNYKPRQDNPEGMMNRDYPYSLQDKTKADNYAGAWALKRILLPSGGQIEVSYESDDYAFVQNKRAAEMMGIIGFGSSSTSPTNALYSVNGSSITENDYVFIRVPEPCADKEDIRKKYLDGLNQLLVKMKVNMPKGAEFMTAYATIADYGVYTPPSGYGIWVRINKVADRNRYYTPLSMTAVEYVRERLPAQAFKAYDVTDGTALDQLKQLFDGMIEGFRTTFSRIPEYLREKGKAQTVQLAESFVRLNSPDGFKYGGGHRVKKITLKDNWDRMTQQYGSAYGQEYDYTTTEVFNGTVRTISSGVASYEPSIGGEENPFQSIVQIANQVPLGPTSYGAIEMPVMDAFFPAPLVGYSKVTVTSIGKKQNPDTLNKNTRSGVGRQVTEFYTARDFPVYYSHTPLDPASNKEEHINPTLTFWYKYAFDSRAISQGFLVATNDMHGKMKSQSSYAENDPALRVNYTENFYRNTGAKGLDEKFDFVYNSAGGLVASGNMGIDVELMTDTREFKLRSSSFEIQAQVDWMLPPPFPLWLPFIWPVSSESENVYRAVTTTKVVNYHAVVDSVLVIDKGSRVSTKNLAYDAETGQVVVNRTNNEFDKPVYSVNYPAYWAYSGMGLAYKNIDAVYTGVTFYDGKITAGMTPAEILSTFESGDELYIINPGSAAGCDPVMASQGNRTLIWALDTAKNSNSLTNPNPYFIFIDSSGKPYTRTGTSFRIVRSGKRNMPGAPLASVALMEDPVDPVTHKLVCDSQSKVVNSSAVEYKEKWQTDNDVFRYYKTIVTNPATCETAEVEDCSGYLEKKINPYVKGLLGNFRGYRSMVFYGDRNTPARQSPTSSTNLPVDGFLADFTPYWNFNNYSNMVPDVSNTKWVWNSEATRFNSKGMELETKDALGIYTAAQYGYRKTLPLAIANNSRYGEMVYEGFEDDGYDDILSNSQYNCEEEYIDFGSLEGSTIGNASEYGITAHTGKRVLKIDANETMKKQISSFVSYSDYELQFAKDTSRLLHERGGTGSCTVGATGNGNSSVGFGDLAMQGYFSWSTDVTDFEYFVNSNTNQYTNITAFGFYTFNLEVKLIFNTGVTGTSLFSVKMFDINNELVFDKPLNCDVPTWGTVVCNDDVSVYLCPGIYRIETNFGADIDVHPSVNFITGFSGDFTYYANTNSISYRSLNTLSTCIFTKPISANKTMMDPVFGMPVKKMVFSAWVRESDINVPKYTHNKVIINNGSGNQVELLPAGPIIEGWQRYEGYFDAIGYPAELQIVNSSNAPIYFDDIRIHPFNSNMKSYVYDPVNLRLTAELDANNYASYYEYDEEGTLIRTKVETKNGIKTVTESRSAKQKDIETFNQ